MGLWITGHPDRGPASATKQRHPIICAYLRKFVPFISEPNRELDSTTTTTTTTKKPPNVTTATFSKSFLSYWTPRRCEPCNRGFTHHFWLERPTIVPSRVAWLNVVHRTDFRRHHPIIRRHIENTRFVVPPITADALFLVDTVQTEVPTVEARQISRRQKPCARCWFPSILTYVVFHLVYFLLKRTQCLLQIIVFLSSLASSASASRASTKTPIWGPS
jgi:hypothetical protein